MSQPVVTLATDAERAECFAIRRKVFVEEQRVPEALELDEDDATALHFLARVDGAPVGTARLLALDADTAKAQRVAVRREARGRGIGHALMDALEAEAARRGHAVVTLHAQKSAEGFYRARGYAPEGPDFDEAGIPHVAMSKRLGRSTA